VVVGIMHIVRCQDYTRAEERGPKKHQPSNTPHRHHQKRACPWLRRKRISREKSENSNRLPSVPEVCEYYTCEVG